MTTRSFRPLRLLPDDTRIPFMRQYMAAFLISGLLCLASLGLLFTKGLHLGIDFSGGILMEVRFAHTVDSSILRTTLSEILPNNELALQQLGTPYDILIRIGGAGVDENNASAIIGHIKAALEGAGIADKFGAAEYRKIDMVGPQVGGELIRNGLYALCLAFVGIMLYLWVRFEWGYGVGAVVSLMHDALLTLGFMSLAGLECNVTSIAAILTVIGYSVNDSVVIYDRIRENLKKYRKKPIAELLDLSLNETLSRTILTVVTTLLAALALILLGGEVIRSFSVTVFVGILIGTYSSIYISAPLLIHLGLAPAIHKP